jgi:hypothetical protein
MQTLINLGWCQAEEIMQPVLLVREQNFLSEYIPSCKLYPMAVRKKTI